MYDVIVVGGGFAGTAAAVAAARQGCSVLLVEQSGFLGGAPGNCLVNPFMPYWTTVNGEKVSLSRGIFTQITRELEALGASMGTTFHEEYLKIVLDRMAVRAGVQLLLHTTLCGVCAEDGRLTAIDTVSKAGRKTFAARYFIDATGDADLAFMAGCPTHLGRESDHLCQPMTLCFRLANVNEELFHATCSKINPLYKQLLARGAFRNPREDVLIFNHPVKGVLHFNTTRVVKLNPTDPFDLTAAELEAREQVLEIFAFLKNNFEAFAQSQLLMTAPQIGVRESRMIDGEHLLTAQELKDCTKFSDAIAAGNYDIDIHNPEGSGTSHYYFPAGSFYTIPYASLVARGTGNLLVAGRCLSATHEAQASIRIMPICCCTGEAAGTAAAVLCQNGTAAGYDKEAKDCDCPALQKLLLDNGAFLGI